jgi:putative ABC transport system substrate-binding protein
MNRARRKWIVASLGSMLVNWNPARAAGPVSRPLIVLTDADLQSSRDAFRKMDDIMREHFAQSRYQPNLRFVPSSVPVTPASYEKLHEELLRLRPDIVIGSNPTLARHVRKMNLGIPILFFSHEDPIASELTDSLVHPGMGMTGFVVAANSSLKRMEMLVRLAPRCRILARIVDDTLVREGVSGVQKESEIIPGIEQRRFACATPDDLIRLMRTKAAREADAWYVAPVGLPWKYPNETVAIFNDLRRPVMYSRVQAVRLGGMAAYESRIGDVHRVWASQIEMLLDGVPIRDIPVAQSTGFTFGLNLRSCRGAGVNPSKALIKVADVVIE